MTIDETKAYLRIAGGEEDALIVRLVASARGLCEAYLGQRLVRGDAIQTLAADGAWHRLAGAPVSAITDVVRGGVAVPVEAYAIDIDPAGDGWVRADGGGRVTVRYRAGLADTAEGVPAAIAQGVVRLAAHLYTHRNGDDAPPPAVASLWRPFRRLTVRA